MEENIVYRTLQQGQGKVGQQDQRQQSNSQTQGPEKQQGLHSQAVAIKGNQLQDNGACQTEG